jgi:hypothetical protein
MIEAQLNIQIILLKYNIMKKTYHYIIIGILICLVLFCVFNYGYSSIIREAMDEHKFKLINYYKTPGSINSNVSCKITTNDGSRITGSCFQTTKYGQTTISDGINLDYCNSKNLEFTPTIINGVLIDHSGKMPGGKQQILKTVSPCIICKK